MEQQLLTAAEDYIKTLFARDAGGHDVYHTLRVYRTALILAAETGADPLITGLAALLHDADDEKLFPETSKTKAHAAGFLREHGVPDETARGILQIIDDVSFRGTDSVTPATAEGRCVQDADRLDALGAIGTARAFAYGGSRGRAMYDPEEPPAENMDAAAYRASRSCTVNHFYEKLFLLPGMMQTEPAKKLAEERAAFMRAFLAQFMREWNGEA